jgi:CspA family cold shock protein
VAAITTRGWEIAGAAQLYGASQPHNDQIDRALSAERITSMATGVITAIRDKGFGFITQDKQGEHGDLFFHRSAVEADGFDRLRTGQRVTFNEEPDPRDASRQRAVNVQPVLGEPAEAAE